MFDKNTASAVIKMSKQQQQMMPQRAGGAVQQGMQQQQTHQQTQQTRVIREGRNAPYTLILFRHPAIRDSFHHAFI